VEGGDETLPPSLLQKNMAVVVNRGAGEELFQD